MHNKKIDLLTYSRISPFKTPHNMNNKLTGYEQVKEFHTVFCHPVLNTEDTTILYTNPELVQFRISLLAEEIKEFSDALEAKDYVEAVDALADTLYVLYGMCLVLGINFDQEIKTYTVPVPSKPISLDETKTYNFDTDSVPNSIDLLNRTLNELTLTTLEKNICEDGSTFVRVKKQLCDLYCATIRAAIMIKLDPQVLEECFAEVHRSNMTKSCVTEEEAQLSVQWYKDSEMRYKEPTYRKSADPRYWVVYDGATSKILKSINVELPQNKLRSILGLS